MKLLFSEARLDYSNYIFPYAIWAVPEEGETPQFFFERGFLPSSWDLKRFYLCRSVRVALQGFQSSSENRRILRKCQDITYELIPQEDFEFSPFWQEFCLTYSDIKFGKGVMTAERLKDLAHSKLTTHYLLFRDQESDRYVGLVTLYIYSPHVVQYYYGFYDLNYYRSNLGMFMMTSAVTFFAERGMAYLYLGTCYSRNATYKTQFKGAEFFNGANWSQNLKELKYLVARGNETQTSHLFETDDYIHRFHDDDLERLVHESLFRLDGE